MQSEILRNEDGEPLVQAFNVALVFNFAAHFKRHADDATEARKDLWTALWHLRDDNVVLHDQVLPFLEQLVPTALTGYEPVDLKPYDPEQDED